MQEGNVICYESIKSNAHEINYVTHELELAAIVHSLKMWRHYLLGQRFVLMTDHYGLRYLFDQTKLNARQSRWMTLLSEFDFKIKHIKEKENRVADTLSRSMKVIHLEAISTYALDIKERAKSAHAIDEIFKTVKSYLDQEPIGLKYEGYQLLNDGVLTYKGRLYVPNSDGLRRFILDELHKIPYTGHPGYKKISKPQRNYSICRE
jgi:hypothetical protein